MAASCAVRARRRAAAWPSTAVPDARLEPLGAGHINDTWLVTTDAGRFVLQRLNARVFPEPRALMAKVAAVVKHLRGGSGVVVPRLLTTATGDWWHEDDAGEVWRLSEYVAGTRALATLENPAQAEAAGRAVGAFQQALEDFTAPVPEPIPGFMQLSGYLAALDAAVAARTLPAGLAPLLAAVDARRDLASEFAERNRLVHGDCKIDNLLFHADRDEVACIIDLDTVMHGHWAWDFGDLVRSAAGTGDGFCVERFAAIARGFRVAAGIAPGVDAMVRAPRYVALMLAVRFLTDHLEGDRYFKVVAPGDNLARARRQLRVLESMERQALAMDAAVRA